MRYFWFTLLLITILAVFAGCQRPEPQTPMLIAPQDGASFDTIPPTLIWTSSNPENEYLVKIDISEEGKDTNLICKVKSVDKDTSLVFTFEIIEYATIKWCVGVEVDTGTLWSETRTFYIDTRDDVPELISPADGAVFDSLPPTFIWSKEDVSEYYLMIYKDSFWNKNVLMCNTLHDTTYSLSTEDIIWNNLGTYVWTVMVKDTLSDSIFYPKPRTFEIKFNDTTTPPPPPIDLDTTYFPFGLGYEWCFETYDFPENQYSYESFYDTTIISVTDSSCINKTVAISLSGSFVDVGNNVQIWDNQLDVFGVYTGPVSYYPGGTISLIPEAKSSDGFSVSYRGDTLVLYSGYDEQTYVGWGWMKTTRLREIGVIYQSHGEGHYGYPPEGERIDYRLLWFFNGKDTVYKAP